MFIPHLSKEALGLPLLGEDSTGDFLDASMFAINKIRRFATLVAACKLCEHNLRSEVYYRFYGDKEIFWMASEVVGDLFPPVVPLDMEILGWDEVDSAGTPVVCGKVIFLYQSLPIFWNLGLLVDKYKPKLGVGKQKQLKTLQ